MSAIQKYFYILFTTPELAFYFREQKEITKLNAKFTKENATDTQTEWIRKLLTLGNIDTKSVLPEVIHNHIHTIYSANCSDLFIEEYRKETIDILMNNLTNYIFGGWTANVFSYTGIDPDNTFAFISVHHIVQMAIALIVIIILRSSSGWRFGFKIGNAKTG